MTIRVAEARQLCTKAELELYLASLPKSISRLPPAKLKAKVTRTRKLRDKFRDLADRQRREARGRESPSGRNPSQGNARTRRKQELFEETLSRYQERLAQLESSSGEEQGARAATSGGTMMKKKAAKKSTAKKTAKKTATAKKAAPKKAAKKKKATYADPPVKVHPGDVHEGNPTGIHPNRPGTQAKAKKTEIKRSGQPRIQGHVASRTRRKQAKRDAKQ